MKTSRQWTAWAVTAMISIGSVAAAIGLLSCASPASPPASAASARPQTAPTLQDRIAHELAAASPVADPADIKARDAAGDRISQLKDLQSAMQKRILWGGFDAKKGYNPAAYRLTAFDPPVWAKIYLSTFMFPGQYEVRQEGPYTVLEIAAKFRNGLDPGDYPYPFWHSAQKWQAYVDAAAVMMVFEDDHLVAAFRKAVHDPAKPMEAKTWDGNWTWTDVNGHMEPRAALYSYLLSPGNPHVAELDAAYRKLAASFREQHCMGCHSPDNKAQADPLFLLNFPNQALATRHTLSAILKGNKMPPPNPEEKSPGGIADEKARQDLIQLAEDFERVADTALAYDAARKTSP